MIAYYTQAGCGSCIATKRTMDKLGLEYETIDVTNDEDAREELRQLGASQMPVIVAGNKIITGYKPAELKALVA